MAALFAGEGFERLIHLAAQAGYALLAAQPQRLRR